MYFRKIKSEAVHGVGSGAKEAAAILGIEHEIVTSTIDAISAEDPTITIVLMRDEVIAESLHRLQAVMEAADKNARGLGCGWFSGSPFVRAPWGTLGTAVSAGSTKRIPLQQWLRRIGVHEGANVIVNVAGATEEENPGIAAAATRFLLLSLMPADPNDPTYREAYRNAMTPQPEAQP